MDKDVFVLGINGSPNKDGRGVGFLKIALEQAEREGAKIQLVHLADRKDIVPLLKKADGVVFSTPVHWFNMSTLMKEFIDSLTPLEYPAFPLEGKVAGFIATCDEDGGMQAISQMLAPLNHLGFVIPAYATVFRNLRIEANSEGEWMVKDLRLLGRNVVHMARSINTKDHLFWDYKNLK